MADETPNTEYPKMVTDEVTVDHPTMGKIRRVVPRLFPHGHARYGHHMVFHSAEEEKAYHQEDSPSASPEPPAASPDPTQAKA